MDCCGTENVRVFGACITECQNLHLHEMHIIYHLYLVYVMEAVSARVSVHLLNMKAYAILRACFYGLF